MTSKHIVTITILISSALSFACQQKAHDAPPEHLEANKQLIKNFYRALNDTSWQELRSMIAGNYQHHTIEGDDFRALSWDEFQQGYLQVRSAFPDWKLTVDKIVAEDDMVSVIVYGEGTHEGNFGPIPASNKKVKAPLAIMHRIEDGKITGDWEIVNIAAVMQQME